MRDMDNWIPPEKYYAQLPQKTVGSAVLLKDNDGRILIVKPAYKSGWLFPGGVVEKEESPLGGALREVLEEVGLRVTIKRLLGIDWSTKIKRVKNKTFRIDHVIFVFDGGVLKNKEIEKISIDKDEITEYAFVSPKKASTLLRKSGAKRMPHILSALEKGTTFYLEEGMVV